MLTIANYLLARVFPRSCRVLTVASCPFVLAVVLGFACARAAEDEPGPPSPETQAKVASLIDSVMLPDLMMDLDPRRSKLIRTKRPVERFSITNPDLLEVVQFGPTEFELIGANQGQTTLTLWFADAGAVAAISSVT